MKLNLPSMTIKTKKKSSSLFEFPKLDTNMFKIKPMVDIIPILRTPKNSKPSVIYPIIPDITPKPPMSNSVPSPKTPIIIQNPKQTLRKKQHLAKPKVRRNNVMFKGKDYDIKPTPPAKKISTILNNHGGRCYIVGGYIRDILLDKRPKDIDIEVHGMTIDDISSILRTKGYRVDEVGKSFGVLKVKDPESGEIIDVAVPRTDSTGRKPDVSFLKSATPYEAAKRRDITINAIMYDTKDDKIVDPFNGVKDLERGNIRHVSDESFSDDPLRTVRAAQFASRFGFTIDPETKKLARDVDASKMAPERVTEEMRKVFEKSKRPSIFFHELDEMGQLEKLFPEVKQLQNVRQDPIHHPEGNAYIHTMQVMDRISESDKRKLEQLVAALFHDLGKITKSTEDPVTKRIHAKGHEEDSEKMAAKILYKYKFTNDEIKYILMIIKNHMKPHMLVNTDAMRLKHKHGLMRDICTTRDIMKDPTGSIQKYCDVIEFAKQDHTKHPEKYEELKRLPPSEHYIPTVTGQDLIDRGYSGKELGDMLEEIYLSKINHFKKKKEED
jgi:tRNA nucleotidyltransferase (CCA-adding enzyme)